MESERVQIRPLAFIGPSGCGKSSLLAELTARGLVLITPTWTDRPARPGEPELEHKFVTTAEFDDKARDGHFAAVVQPFELPFRYGFTPLQQSPGKVPVAMIRSRFVDGLRRFYPAVRIYQIEANFHFAKKAMLARGDEFLGTRLSDFDHEIATGRQSAHRVFENTDGNLTLLANAVEAAIREDDLIPGLS